jgi:hypothetical protein
MLALLFGASQYVRNSLPAYTSCSVVFSVSIVASLRVGYAAAPLLCGLG